MSNKMNEAIKSIFNGLPDLPPETYFQEGFFRDPARTINTDDRYFLSPADGFVIYSGIINPDEAITEVKGKKYSIQDIIRDKHYDKRSLVIGIFMTCYDVHINRIPYDGILSYAEHEPLETNNLPMIDVENNIFYKENIELIYDDYLYLNQRVVNKVYSPGINREYYMVQVGDYDVDTITPFHIQQNTPVYQGDRFSMIRYGSQVDLVIPVADDDELTSLVTEKEHVTGGMTKLVRINDNSL